MVFTLVHVLKSLGIKFLQQSSTYFCGVFALVLVSWDVFLLQEKFTFWKVILLKNN